MLSERAQHNEGREPTMRDVREILSKLREGSTSNPDVLGIEQHEVMLALNKGYPKPMYHAELDPVSARDKQDEKYLVEIGYSPRYIFREFPMHLFRRNFHPRFRPDLDLGTGLPKADSLEFIETRLVKTAHDLEKLMREPAPYMPAGVPKPGPWVKLLSEIPPIEAGSEEELRLENARIMGQLEESRQHAHDVQQGARPTETRSALAPRVVKATMKRVVRKAAQPVPVA